MKKHFVIFFFENLIFLNERYMNVALGGHKFKLKPEILKASVILKILPRLSDRISNKEVILPCDFERIIRNIDLFDEKYGLIIKSDEGKSLNPIVDLYIESICGMHLNTESNKEIPFLDFLELFYQDKSKWKF